MWNITLVIGCSLRMKKESVLAGSSYWVHGSWVLNFEIKIQNWKLEMGTSQQAEPKLGTGLQLEPDSVPELTPELIACNFWFFIFLN